MERVRGNDPLSLDWQPRVIPLYYTRFNLVGDSGIEPLDSGCKPDIFPLN